MSDCAAPGNSRASSAIPGASSRPNSWRASCARARRYCSCTVPTIRWCRSSRWRMPRPRSKPPAFRSRPWRARGSSTRSIQRGCSAAVRFCNAYSALRPLELCILRRIRQKRLQHLCHLLGIPFGGALDAADHFALAVDNQRRRQAAHREGVADHALRVEIGLDLVEAELGDERLDDILPPAVLGYRRHGQLVLAPPLPFF